jgi:hypothetical protein
LSVGVLRSPNLGGSEAVFTTFWSDHNQGAIFSKMEIKRSSADQFGGKAAGVRGFLAGHGGSFHFIVELSIRENP